MTTVFVAGATGNLGSRIVTELLQRAADVRALVRTGKEDGGERLRELTANPRLSLVVGDLSDVDSLVPHLDGVEVIVSALQGGPDVIIDGQRTLLRAAERAGVPRMIPSDFSGDLHRLDYGDNLFLDWRKNFDDELRSSATVQPTFVLTGGFMDIVLSPFFGILDVEQHTVSYWGDPDQPLDFTTIADVAKYAAATALDASTAGRTVSVAGDVVTANQLKELLEQATGTTVTLQQRGTLDQLRAEIERIKPIARNPFDYVSLQYLLAMFSGKSKLQSLDNDRYPDITPTTVAGLLSQRPGH